MGNPFDLIGSLQQGASLVGGALKNLTQPSPSRPAPSPHAPLPQPQAPATQPQSSGPNHAANWKNAASSFGNAAANSGANPLVFGKNLLDSSFAKDMGIRNLASNFTSQDTTNKDSYVGQVANLDPSSTLAQAKQAWKGSDSQFNRPNPIAQAGNYVANVLNAGVIDPIALAANPQMWFAEDNNKHWSPDHPLDNTGKEYSILGSGPGHNYLRDMFNPIVKKITGEDVPPTPMGYEAQSKTLVEERQRLDAAQASLTPGSSAEDVAAFNSAVTQYNLKADEHFKAYEKSADWWANSNTAKVLSLLGQAVTFPAGFAAGMVTFLPQLAADPIGTGESMVSQVSMAGNFAETLMDPEKRDHMSAQELGANISNVAMLAGMLFGPKGAGKAAKGVAAVSKDTFGVHADRAAQAHIQTELHQYDPSLHAPEPAPHAVTPTIDPNGSPVDRQVHEAMRQEDLSTLREKSAASTDENEKAALLKQINDITDEQRVIDATPKPSKSGWEHDPIPGETDTHVKQDKLNSFLVRSDNLAAQMEQGLSVRDLKKEIDALEVRFNDYHNWAKNQSFEKMEPSWYDIEGALADTHKSMMDRADINSVDIIDAQARLTTMFGQVHDLMDAKLKERNSGSGPGGQLLNRDQQVSSDIGREKQGERPQYTRPVYPSTGFPDKEVETMVKGLEDFSRPASQVEALRKNPQDYASPNAKVPGEAPREMTIEEHKAAFDAYQKSGKHDEVRSSMKQWTQSQFAAQRKRDFQEGERSPDYVDPNAKAPASAPTVKFEELDPRTFKSMARSGGFEVTTIPKAKGNFWVTRNQDVINIGGAFDPQGNHDMFIRAMKLPGDGRNADANGEHVQTKMDMMHSGMIRGSDFGMFLNLGVDRFDHENLPVLDELIRSDMTKNERLRPYVIDSWDTGEHFTIDPQELMANGDLGNLISQIRRMNNPRTELPEGPTPPKLLKQAVEGAGWKMVPGNKVNYGFLFKDNKGTDIGGFESEKGHSSLWDSFNDVIGREITPKEYQELTADVVELRRGYGPQGSNDHYFFAQKWTDTTLKIVENYLQQKSTRPNTITLESRYGTGNKADVIGGRAFRGSDTSFGWSDFKSNDFRLEGLLNRKSFAPFTEIPEGSYLWDKFRALTKAENQIKFFEDRIGEYATTGKNTRKDEIELQRTLGDVQRTIADLPGEVSPKLVELRDRLQEKLNEKGYTAIAETSTESATGEARQGLNKTPPGAEGTTLTSVIAGPKGEGQVSFWTPDAKSTGTVSPRERGRVELVNQLTKEVEELTNAKQEVQHIAILEALPKNEARRVAEVTEVVKANIDGLDPMGYATPEHVVFDRNLNSEALYEQSTGLLRVNVTRLIPVDWLQGVAGTIQKSMIDLKGKVSEPGYVALHDWFTEIKNMSQAMFDWSVVAEEVLHKYDTDHLPADGYLDALSRLPWQWWDHARRSGIGDVVEGGITARKLNYAKDEDPYFTLKAVNGEPVTSWYQAFALARQDGPFGALDEPSYHATLHTFMEFRVTQLRNYHGIPGTKFTYRVPEVMIREVENPDLIREGATIAGNDFERYVKTEVADGLAALKAYEKEKTTNDGRGNASTASTSTVPGSPNARVPGRNAGDQTHLDQDFPQVGDKLQINKGTPEKPQWVDFWNDPIRNADDARAASRIVSSRGMSEIYSRPQYATEYRVVNPKGGDAVRNFKDAIPEPPQEQAPVSQSSDGGPIPKNPATFHNIPAPNVEPVDLTGRTKQEDLRKAVVPGQISQAGFSKKTLRLSESDPINVPVPHAIGEGYTEPTKDGEGKSIAQSLKYKPIIALRDTGYPGSWVDFLQAMSQPEGEVAYRTAKPYWDALEPKYKIAWMEAMREPGVQEVVMNHEPSPEAVSPEEMNSPEFMARQAKIQEYQAVITGSGRILDKLSKTVNTAAGLAKYAQAKAKVAMAAKFVSIPPGVPFKEAYQLAGAEYSRVMDEITKQPEKVGQPRDPQVEAMTRPKSLINQLTPQIRSFITGKVVRKTTEGKLADGFYKSLDAFVDGYAVREEAAVKLYRTLPSTSKTAIKNLTDQYPQAFKLGTKDTPDQTSIPLSAQASKDHINPVSPEQLRAVAQGAIRAIVRHGSTDYNERGLIRGHSDPPLSSLGRLQARNLARAFMGRRGLKIVSHDLSRAQETANSIASRAPGAKVEIDSNLRPWDVGNELTGSSVVTANPKIQDWAKNQPDYVPPGGESFNQFKARYLPALKQHLIDKDLIVVSTRNQRLAEGWIAKDMPDDLSIDEGYMVNPREVGPGGIIALGNKSDGNYTVTHRVSQAPSDAEAMAAPAVPKSSEPLRPTQYNVDMSKRTARPDVAPVKPEPEGVSPQVRYNFKIGEQAETKAANIRGELTPAMPKDVVDRIDAIVADPSIHPTNPLKVAAVRAQVARKGIESARAMQVPKEAVDEQVKEYTTHMEKASSLMAQKAQEAATAAPLTAPKLAPNKMVWDTSLTKAKEHRERMLKGSDWAASTTRAAREIMLQKSSNPLGDMIGMLKDGSDGLLDGQKDHLYHSLSPAFKEVFVDPHAVEVVRQANLSERKGQGLLPLETDKLLGADVPVAPLPFGAEAVKKATAQRKAKATPKQQAKVTPAIAETLRSRTPNPDAPVEEPVANMEKRYKFQLGEDAKMTSREHRQETEEIHKAIQQPSPDLLSEGEQELNMRDVPENVHDVEDQISKVNTSGDDGGNVGSGDGGNHSDEPLNGWDDAHDMLASHGGDYQVLARIMGRGLKAQAKSIDASSKYAHPVQMAIAHIYARVQAMHTGDQIEGLLSKLYPAKMNADRSFANPEELARHQALAKAIGGEEVDRQKALKTLSPQDQAVANTLHQYHEVMGRIGTRPETHVFDHAVDGYLRRKVLFDDAGVAPHGNSKFTTKMGIAFHRRQREEVVGTDKNGKNIIKSVNYYKDTQALKDAGFKVEENIANLWKGHWDQFSNMNITQQFIRDLSTLDSFTENAINKRGQVPWVGRVLVPRFENGKSTQLGSEYAGQVTTVIKGPFTVALRNYHVYKPVADILERLATRNEDTSFGDKAANAFAYANGIYKVIKFGYNPLHAYNLWSNLWAHGTHGLLDPATYNPLLLHHRIFGRVDELLSEKGSYPNWDGTPMHGTDVINKILGWGGVLSKEVTDVAGLGGLTGTLSRHAPLFKEYHKAMWHDLAWKAHIGLVMHQMDVARVAFKKAEGRDWNEAEFDNAGVLSTEMSKYAMGFLDKTEMTHNWQVYANALYLANSWSLSQLRLLGMALPQAVPGAKYLANLGGGEKYNEIISSKMMANSGMTQRSLNTINGMRGRQARRMMLGGSAKLIAMSTIIAYLGSYLGNQGQPQGPYENFMRDPTHTFDVYLGVDENGKDKWQHNPLFGMQQEMLLYMLEGVKGQMEGKSPFESMASVAGRYMGKNNPVLRATADLAVGRNLGLWVKGYGDRSAIDKDPQVIAIRRALDATGMNPFPDSLTNNLIYAIREVSPITPGFPDQLHVKDGTYPAETNSTLGNVLNALGPGKFLGIGDLMNAIKNGPEGADWPALIKMDLGNLAQFALGTSQRTSTTPQDVAASNVTGAAIATRDVRNQALDDLSHAATAGDWKTVAQISQQLNLSTAQMTSALLHPTAGGGQGVLYQGLPARQNYSPPAQEVLLGQELSPADTSALLSVRNANVMAAIKQVSGMADFKLGDGTTRASAMTSYISLVESMTNDQFAQGVGLLGGTPITDADIQGALNTAIEFRGISQDALSQTDLYVQADPLERQRMETTYGSFASTLAKDGYMGNLKGVPIDNIKDILVKSIEVTEATRSYLESSMFYQLAAPGDQQRMLKEYSSLAQTVAKREALQQGQGTYNFQIPPEKMVPTIQFIINIEEMGKAELHGTSYYNSQDPTVQRSLDSKYETLARGLAFSKSNADPRILIRNSLNADQSYYDLQNQFGGNNYIRTMAQELADAERNIRTTAEFSPRQIAAIERGVRVQFLRANPAYAAWLTAKTKWAKYSTNGQIYTAMNNAEWAAVDDMQSSGVIGSDSLLVSGTMRDNTPMDPGTSMGLPSVSYSTFNAQNP